MQPIVQYVEENELEKQGRTERYLVGGGGGGGVNLTLAPPLFRKMLATGIDVVMRK
jgi:hypothetical protein